ncbi:endonuclease 8-like 1 [Rhinophrynus dorsalis]
MPEGPELHLASLFINKTCAGLCFGGKVEKSAVSKNAEVPFCCKEYTISSISRGKELKLILTPGSGGSEVTHIVFRFGMSGSFKLTSKNEIPKHAHLRFYTKDAPHQVLSFVDPRRFGSWEVNGSWQTERGPCVMLEYDKFRENVLRNLTDKVFDKPICEVLLNQKYFNGIGNYLRAEILFRLQIPPFMPARPVLEAMKYQNQGGDISLSKKIKLKKENPDLLHLCNLVPMEVINLGGKGYDPQHSDDYSGFVKWLRCYFVPGMKTLKDSNGRTIWFQGDPGPLAPKDKKAKKRNRSVDSGWKPAKVERTTAKRKVGVNKKVAVKKEEKELAEDKTLNEVEEKERGKKITNELKEDNRINVRKRMEKEKREKKVRERTEEKEMRARRGSYKSFALNSSARPLKDKAGLQLLKESPPHVSRPRRLKHDGAVLPPGYPVTKRRSMRKTAGRVVAAQKC